MSILISIQECVEKALAELFGIETSTAPVLIQKTRKDFAGDYTINVFPFVKEARTSPEKLAEALGSYLTRNLSDISDFNIVKGFLNLVIAPNYWQSFVVSNYNNADFGIQTAKDNRIVIEFSSPNTNKPLHLGHIRNNLLGESLSRILAASGNDVVKVNLVNDRGIHICKSMLAWQLWGNGTTPDKQGLKGDKLVGNFYVLFDKEYKKAIAELTEKGMDPEKAEKQAEPLKQAQELLRKWEAGDTSTLELWNTMNNWVYRGFEDTYKRMGITFHKTYYESQTYMLGKKHVLQGLEKGVLQRDADGSVWADFTEQGMDRKILLRSDGTSVYMTQDIGTAELRYQDYEPNQMIYVVGNEQDYHFKVLKLVLGLLGFNWSETIQHFSYGMVELPEGKMKSREGTVVDADDLIDEVVEAARQMALDSDKLKDLSAEEREQVCNTIGLGALKYFILKVDPKKKMMFNPEESVQLQGNTGPFIQYAYARANSILRKTTDDFSEEAETNSEEGVLNDKDTELAKLLHDLPQVINDAAQGLSPALIANYVYELAREFNQFYTENPILKESDEKVRKFRLLLTSLTAVSIKTSMNLLGIDVPERM